MVNNKAWTRVGASAVVCALLVVFLTACIPYVLVAIPSTQELVGAWATSDRVGSIVLRPDGSFEARDIPSDVLDPTQWDIQNKEPEGPLVSAVGTWEISRDRDTASQPFAILTHQDSEQLSVASVVLIFQRAGNYELRFSLGDPDSHFFYVLERVNE